MSSRAYYLRNRAGSGVATQTSRAADEPPSYTLETDIPLNEIAPQAEDSVPNSGAIITARLYSDVTASRPPSPMRDRQISPSGNPTVGLGRNNVPRRPDDRSVHSSDESSSEGHESSEEIETPDKIEDVPWTTIQRKRARSLDSFENRRQLTKEQAKAIKEATEKMTAGQKQQFQRRQERVRPRRDSSVSSRGEGPSKPKGKGIDPREWGNVNISRDSLDIDAQAAALDSYKQQSTKSVDYSKKRKHHSKERSQSSKRKDDQQRRQKGEYVSKRDHRHSAKPAESQPAAQIAPKSYLGAALKHIGCSKKENHYSDSPSHSDSSPSSSSDSSSTSEPSDDSSQSETSEEESDESESDHHRGKRRRDNQHGRNRRPRHSSSSRSKIKPIPPKEYDGSVDIRAYH